MTIFKFDEDYDRKKKIYEVAIMIHFGENHLTDHLLKGTHMSNQVLKQAYTMATVRASMIPNYVLVAIKDLLNYHPE
jgi:hypothetical protein